MGLTGALASHTASQDAYRAPGHRFCPCLGLAGVPRYAIRVSIFRYSLKIIQRSPFSIHVHWRAKKYIHPPNQLFTDSQQGRSKIALARSHLVRASAVDSIPKSKFFIAPEEYTSTHVRKTPSDPTTDELALCPGALFRAFRRVTAAPTASKSGAACSGWQAQSGVL